MDVSIYPGYKPNPPREEEELTEREWERLMGVVGLLAKIKRKNELRKQRDDQVNPV